MVEVDVVKASTLRDHTVEELRELCGVKRKALCDMRVNRLTGDATEQPLMMRQYRREIAQILTVLNERESKENG
jgi:ribosomal protein L29